MADTNGFIIDFESEFLWGSSDIVSTGLVDTPGFFLPDPEILFGNSQVVTSGLIDSSGFLLPDLEILFGSSAIATTNGCDSRGFLIDIVTIPGLDSDDGFLFDFNSNLVPAFIGNSAMTEIIYPVVPISEANKVLFRLDSEEWRVTQKAAAARNEDVDTMRFRVSTDYMATFLGNLYANKANQFRLSTPGYTPFGLTSEDNYVRVLSHSRPQREDRGLTQTIDVTFLFMAAYP